MRPLKTSLVVAAVLASAPASAQSAYDYPWCGIYTSSQGAGGAQSCYFATYEQCRATMDRLGICTQSPYYRGGGPREPRRPRYRSDY